MRATSLTEPGPVRQAPRIYPNRRCGERTRYKNSRLLKRKTWTRSRGPHSTDIAGDVFGFDPDCTGWSDSGLSLAAGVVGFGKFGRGARVVKDAEKGAESALSQAAKRRLAKRLGEVPRSSSPVAQGGSAKTGRWWEHDDVRGKRKIVVEHPDGTVHVGIPKPQSTHTTGDPPKYYDYGNFGHVGG